MGLGLIPLVNKGVIQSMRFLLAIIIAVSSQAGYAANNKSPSAQAQETIVSKEFNYQIGPVPAYVMPESENAPSEKGNRDVGDILFPFYDRQVSLLKAEPEEYVHFKIKPLTVQGLQDASQVYITFNPAYQKLTVHAIRILRDGKEINLTSKVKLDLMRRENNLDKNVYEGNVTAVGVLPDTRVNDVIDIEYTVSGQNPIFDGHYAGLFSVTQMNHLDRYHLSLVTKEGRTLRIRPPVGMQVKESNEKGTVRYTVAADNIKPFRFEDETPKWYLPNKYVEISEYQDWTQVSVWANNLFRVDNALSAEIQKQVQQWKDTHLSQEQLAVEVLRWVQSEIRYFGIEMGVNSHLPSPPNLTVARKFGDCKDKSLLLAALLKALGMDAEPVLASLWLNRNVEHMVPSPAIFDHAIVRLRLDGKVYWLDPTWMPQYGKLDKLGASDYGWVLVLGEENGKQLQFSGYPPNYENSLQKTNRYTVKSINEPVQLTVQIKASFYLAENIRYMYGNQSKDEFEKVLQEDVLRMHPKAKLIGDVIVKDDKVNNQMVIAGNFTIEDFLQYEPGRLTASFFAAELQKWMSVPRVSQRNSPYFLPKYSRVTEIAEFEFPENPDIKLDKASSTQAKEFWNLTSNSDLQRNKFVQTWVLKAKQESVPSQKIGEYMAEIQSARKLFGMSVRLPVGNISGDDNRTVNKELQRLNRVYGESNSGRVAVERKGAIDLVLATRDINSRKLGDKHLAEAYKIRSHAYDNQGEVQRSLDDIRMAIKLDPENAEYKVSEATILKGDGQFIEAKLKYEQALQMGKLSGKAMVHAYRRYAETLHYLGQNEQARDMLDEALRQASGEEMIYIAIWRYIVSARTVKDSAETLRSAMGDIQGQVWPYSVGEMLLGNITPEQLIEAAKSSDKGVQEDQYCEAYFYIGQKHRIGNNMEEAKENFRKSVEQGVIPFAEHGFSLHELGGKRTPREEGLWQWLKSL